MICSRYFLAAAILLAAGVAAWAVPPLTTDDAEVAEKDTFEIYSGFDYESDAGSITRQLPTTELDYGIIDRVELSLVVPVLSLDGQHGIGDLHLGTKVILLKETKTLPGIAAGFDWKLTNGSVARGLGSGKFDYNFLVPVQKTWGWFTAMVNVGFTFVGNPEIDGVTERRDNTWFAGFAQRYKVNDKTVLLSEIYAQRAEEPGQPNRFAAAIGFEREIVHDLALQASVGKSLREASHGGPDFHVYVGLHWTFDAPWKREEKEEK